MSRVTRSQAATFAVNDENAAPKDAVRNTKRGSVAAGAPSKGGPKAQNTRKSVRPALGEIHANRIPKTNKDEMPKKKRVVDHDKQKNRVEPTLSSVEGENKPDQEPMVPVSVQEEKLEKPKDITVVDDAADVDMKGDASLVDSVADLKLSSVDAPDRGDAQAVAEYIRDIMSHLFSTEGKRAPSPTYMSRQTDINAKMREILVDWLVEVHHKFQLRLETLYLTVNIIDRFLERRAVSRTKLQLVGCTAMLMASKYEEIYAPEIKDFVYISDQAYTKEQILAMESIMLNTLGFHLTVPTALRFGERLMKVVDADPETQNMIKYLIELTMQDYKFLRYLPSQIAASAVFLALKRIQKPWTKILEEHSNYTEEELKPCVTDLYTLGIKDPPKYKAVRKKYANKKRNEVSRLPLVDPFEI